MHVSVEPTVLLQHGANGAGNAEREAQLFSFYLIVDRKDSEYGDKIHKILGGNAPEHLFNWRLSHNTHLHWCVM